MSWSWTASQVTYTIIYYCLAKFLSGENLNSAASTKIYVLRTFEDIIECIADHLSRQYYLKKETRDAIADHYSKLIKDIKGGFCEFPRQLTIIQTSQIMASLQVIPPPS